MPDLALSENILDTIKKMLGVDPNYDAFDVDITVNINTAIMILGQIGVGIEDFAITSGDETWDEYLDGATKLYNGAKTYIYLSVKLAFDPPSASFVIESYKRQMEELTFRLNVQNETPWFEP